MLKLLGNLEPGTELPSYDWLIHSRHINRDAKGTHGVLVIDGELALVKVMVVFRSIHRVEHRGTLTESRLNGSRAPFIIKLWTALNSP